MAVVVHLTSSRLFGGPERQMLELARALPAPYRCAFASFREDGHCEDFLKRVRAAGFRGLALKNDSPHLLAATRELTETLRQWDAVTLCCHGYKADLLGLLAGRRIGLPVISVSRGWTWENVRVRLYEMLDRRLLRWMDRVVCVSDGQAAKVRRAGVAEEKIMVIRNSIRTGRFDSPTPAFRERLMEMFPRRPKYVIGAAGRLSPEKGHALLIAAAAEITRADAEVGFVLFGEGGLRGDLEKQIAALGLQGRFILAGHCDDLDGFFPYFDVLVLPSFTEGLPNVALEASAAGVPVVATAVGGTPEVIEDGSTGVLIPPGNPRVMAAAIQKLLASAALRRAYGEAGRRRVRNEFTFAAQAEQYRRLFAELTTEKTSTFSDASRKRRGFNASAKYC